jgi:AcrR family transcriptional regulator
MEMSEERQLRADAERNRRRLLDAAAALFAERGLEVSVGEIAERAGVGRGTLFRNFPTKDDLIAAIVTDRMIDAATRAEGYLEAQDAGDALFAFLEEIFGIQQRDRALFEAVGEEFVSNEQVREVYERFLRTFDLLLRRAQEQGAVRSDVGAMDVMMLTKGACQAALAFRQLDPDITERQLDLVRSALAPSTQPLRGRVATLEDLERMHATPPAEAQSAARGDGPAGVTHLVARRRDG